MKPILLIAAVCAIGLTARAQDLSRYDDMNKVLAGYNVAATEFLQVNDVKAEDAAKGYIDGARKIITVPGDNMFMVYGSRIAYLKGRTLAQVEKAFQSASSLPPPAPMEQVTNVRSEQASATDQVTYFNFTAVQSKLFVKVETACSGATHDVVVSDKQRLVQNKWINCTDVKDSQKLWYPLGWQSNQLVDLGNGTVAVVIQNVIVIHRNRVGIFNPSQDDMFELSQKASEATYEAYLKRLGL